MSFSTSYPGALSGIFYPAQRVGGSSDTFLSFDCFVDDYQIKGPFESAPLFKQFLLIFLPLILFIIVTLLWVIVYLLKRKWVKDLKRNLVISFISIVFLLHPKLTEQSLAMFRCVEIDNGVSMMRMDTDIECYSSKHLLLCLALAVPTLIIWVITLPVIALVLLFKNIKKGEGNKIKQYTLILYQGLKHDRFYWEFVNTLRKVLLLMSLSLPFTLKVLVSIIILIISARLQLRLKPYRKSQNNDVELFAIAAGVITML